MEVVVRVAHQRTPDPGSAKGVTVQRGVEPKAVENVDEPEVAPEIVIVPEGFGVPVPPFTGVTTPEAPFTSISPHESVAKQ